ncbi:MAG: phosphohistidine phosphatase SixA [Planctomycetota bacterium]
MHLYIARHGVTVECRDWHGSDEARPLSEDGKEKIKAVFERLQHRKKIHIDAIWASPLTRALQTAHIAGAVLNSPVKVVQELASGMSLKRLHLYLAKVQPTPERLMLVGHEPDCGIIIAELIGDPTANYSLKKAGVASLVGNFEPGGMALVWRVAPKDIL